MAVLKTKAEKTCDIRPEVCSHFGYFHGDFVCMDTYGRNRPTMWLIVLGVTEDDGAWRLLFYRLGESGAGYLEPMPKDMKVLEKIPTEEVRNRLNQAPPVPTDFTFPFCVGVSNPVICKFDVTEKACKAFGFCSGDLVEDSRGACFAVIGVRREGGKFTLWAHRQDDLGAVRLRVHANLHVKEAKCCMPLEFGPLGRLQCDFTYQIHGCDSVAKFDTRGDVCRKLLGVTDTAFRHGSVVQGNGGHRIVLIGARYHEGCPRVYGERESTKTGARPLMEKDLNVLDYAFPCEAEIETTLKLLDDGAAAALEAASQDLEDAVKQEKHQKQRTKHLWYKGEPNRKCSKARSNEEQGQSLVEVQQGDQANVVRPGALVQVRSDIQTPRFKWGFLKDNRSCIGVVQHISSAAVEVNFGYERCWNGAPDEFQVVGPEDKINVGMHVCVKDSMQDPAYGWGLLRRRSVGVVAKVEGQLATVDFPEQSGWKQLGCTKKPSGEEWKVCGHGPGMSCSLRSLRNAVFWDAVGLYLTYFEEFVGKFLT